MNKKINLRNAAGKIENLWDPHVAGQVNDTDIRIARISGAFDWHRHDTQDEAFFVLRGAFNLEMRDRTITLEEGDFFVVPKGTDHRPVAEKECWIMLVEPSGTINTGNNQASDKTKDVLKRL